MLYKQKFTLYNVSLCMQVYMCLYESVYVCSLIISGNSLQRERYQNLKYASAILDMVVNQEETSQDSVITVFQREEFCPCTVASTIIYDLKDKSLMEKGSCSLSEVVG